MFPNWILVPHEETIRKYIEHEKQDYEKRSLASRHVSRSLPEIDRRQVLYHPLITTYTNGNYKNYFGLTRSFKPWPKPWLGNSPSGHAGPFVTSPNPAIPISKETRQVAKRGA